MKKLILSLRKLLIFMVVLALFVFGLPGEPATVQVLAEGAPILYLPLVLKNFDSGPGMASGKVVDSSLLDTPIADALVCHEGSGLCTSTDELGQYTLGPLPSGWQRLTASMEGFYPVINGAIVMASQPATLNFALSPDFFSDARMRLRIVLTWDPRATWAPVGIPNDLDSHLWLQSTSPAHIYPAEIDAHGDCLNYPNACIEVDYQYGYGPESIAIRTIEPATYYYGVLNYYSGYPGVPPINQTAAMVQIYNKEGLLREFHVPPSGNGEFWYVFSMDSDGNITETNCIIALPEAGQLPQCP
jgi:hypothetical protein